MKKVFFVLLHAGFLFGSSKKFDLSKFDHNPYWGWGNYTRFAKFVDRGSISTIFEVGSRDACDAINLSQFFKAQVVAFECNPVCIEKCRINCAGFPDVTFVPLACWHENAKIPFYPVEFSGHGIPVNIGASSCFRVLQNGPYASDRQSNPILVEATRLDTWIEKSGIKTPELVCIDAQGATLNILRGLGEKIREIKYIIAEIGLVQGWEQEKLADEIYDFMHSKGFVRQAIDSSGPFADAFFVNISDQATR